VNAVGSAGPGGTVECAPLNFTADGILALAASVVIQSASADVRAVIAGVTCTGPLSLGLKGIAVPVNSVHLDTGVAAILDDCDIGTVDGGGASGAVTLRGGVVHTQLLCTSLFAEGAILPGVVHVASGAPVRLTNCTFAPTVITFVGGPPGTAYMDEASYNSWLTTGNSIVNGRVEVLEAPFRGMLGIVIVDPSNPLPSALQNGSYDSPYQTLGVGISFAVPGGTVKVPATDFSPEGVVAVALPVAIECVSKSASAVIAGAAASAPLALVNVASPAASITTTAAATLAAVDCPVLLGIERTGANDAGNVNLVNTFVTPVNPIGCLNFTAKRSPIAANINCDGTSATFEGCAFQGARTITFNNAGGLVVLDVDSYASWLSQGCSVFNGTVVTTAYYDRALSHQYFVDGNTAVPAAARIGSEQAPFITIAEALAYPLTYDAELCLVSADYAGEGTIAVDRNLKMRALGAQVLGSVTTNLAAVTVAAGKTLQLTNVNVAGDVDLPATASLTLVNSSVIGNITDVAVTGGGIVAMHQSRLTGPVTAKVAGFWAVDSFVLPSINTSSVLVVFDNCTFGAPPTITFAAPGGVINMYGSSAQSWANASGTVVNGRIEVLSDNPSAIIPASVPVSGTDTLSYLDLVLTGTVLENMVRTNTPVHVNPVGDIAQGADTGFLANWYASANNTVRLTFRGVLTGSVDQDYVVTVLQGTASPAPPA
jgi:hypothetical protein